jgi:hypothetical protein
VSITRDDWAKIGSEYYFGTIIRSKSPLVGDSLALSPTQGPQAPASPRLKGRKTRGLLKTGCSTGRGDGIMNSKDAKNRLEILLSYN